MTSAADEIKFEARRATELYVAGSYDALSDYFIDILARLKGQRWAALTPEIRRFATAFSAHFGSLFTQQDYVLSNRHAEIFIGLNPVIANLVAMSPFKTTDAWLEILRPQQANLAKVLTLLNARCESVIDVQSIFNADPTAASIWYRTYYELFHTGMPTRILWDNARRHLAQADPRVVYVGPGTGDYYFFLSYISLEREADLKRLFHQLVRPIMARAVVRNRPDPRSIAIVTARWTRSSAVYKSLAPFVEALRRHYRLTLVRITGAYKANDDFDPSWFSSIRTVRGAGTQLDVSEILDNDFALAYFPDVGMQPEDRHLCNLRFAHIQAMGYGHPVSTHGAEMDYFIGGREVEKLDNAEQNYSERLVAIPGLGAFPVLPQVKLPVTLNSRPGPLIINCPWSGYKCNYPHLLLLREIAERCGRPVLFRFFIGQALAYNIQAISFTRELEETVGEGRIETVAEKPYPDYQQWLDEGAFSLDSFPFGGYNTIVDCLALGKPVVTLQGNHASNRLASALLRRVGLAELVATSNEEYVALALRLIRDSAYRDEVRDRLSRVNLEQALCKPEEPQAFKRAIDYLIRNHARLTAEGGRQPIVIE